jgi:hypothetical protein
MWSKGSLMCGKRIQEAQWREGNRSEEQEEEGRYKKRDFATD